MSDDRWLRRVVMIVGAVLAGALLGWTLAQISNLNMDDMHRIVGEREAR